MRALFISQLFDPEYSIKGLGFLEEIRDQGFKIDVVTTFPNYPTGKLFPGYKLKPWQIEMHGDIRVIRVFSYISHSRSRISRALNYLSFMVAAFLASMVIKKPDVIYAYHPQLTTGIIASILKKLRGTPFITDVQDLWPDALYATGLQVKGAMFGAINRLCNFVYQASDHIVVLSNGYKDALVSRGVAADKISVIYNWHADETSELGIEESRVLPEGFDHTFVYAGNLGAAQSLKSVISAFSKRAEKSVCLVIIGSGVEEMDLIDHSRIAGSKNIFFLGYIPSNEIRKYLSQADALVVHLRDDPLFKITIPSKVQAYLSSQKPILIAVGGEANQIVSDAGAGVSAEPGNVLSIMSAIDEMLASRHEWREMGSNGRSFYKEKMSRSRGVIKIVSVLRKMQK